jgi:hypothetical protein
MKQTPAILIILFLGMIACNQPSVGRNGVAFKSAVQYNDYIVNRQAKHIQNVLDFAKAAGKDLDSAEKMLDKFSGETATIIEELSGMPAYKGDSSLRDAAVSIFNFYKKVFQIDYPRIIRIRKKGDEMTNEELKEMKDIVGRITRDEEGYDKSFHNTQKDFADKNNIKVTENEMQKKFEKEIGQ